MLTSIKHFVQCRCIVQGSSHNHQFQVFSIVENDEVKVKFAQCNNCGIIHRVDEINHSSIVNREAMSTIVTIEDVAASLNEKIVDLFKKNNVNDVSLWEEAKFIIDNERWGEFIVISRETIDGELTIKLVRFVGKNLFIIDHEQRVERI